MTRKRADAKPATIPSHQNSRLTLPGAAQDPTSFHAIAIGRECERLVAAMYLHCPQYIERCHEGSARGAVQERAGESACHPPASGVVAYCEQNAGVRESSARRLAQKYRPDRRGFRVSRVQAREVRRRDFHLAR